MQSSSKRVSTDMGHRLRKEGKFPEFLTLVPARQIDIGLCLFTRRVWLKVKLISPFVSAKEDTNVKNAKLKRLRQSARKRTPMSKRPSE